jgi:hypothetical protein
LVSADPGWNEGNTRPHGGNSGTVNSIDSTTFRHVEFQHEFRDVVARRFLPIELTGAEWQQTNELRRSSNGLIAVAKSSLGFFDLVAKQELATRSTSRRRSS